MVYPVRRKVNVEGLDYSFHIGRVQPVHPDVAIVAGECLFNIRSALDHLVYQLHVRHYRGRVPAKIEQASAFPILDKPRIRKGRRVPTSEWREIGTLAARQRTTIEFLQPYNRRDDRYESVRRALSTVNRLCNVDKHRHLHVVTASVLARTVPDVPPQYGFRQHGTFFKPLEDGAEVERWTFENPPPQVPMHYGAFVEVGVHDGADFIGLVILMEILLNRLEVVVARFEPLFA